MMLPDTECNIHNLSRTQFDDIMTLLKHCNVFTSNNKLTESVAVSIRDSGSDYLGPYPKLYSKLFAEYEPRVRVILAMYLTNFINQHVNSDQICFGAHSDDVSKEMALVHKAAERCR